MGLRIRSSEKARVHALGKGQTDADLFPWGFLEAGLGEVIGFLKACM